MKVRFGIFMTVLAFISCLMTYAGVPKRDPLSIIPVQQRTQLSERLALYVKANLDRNWEKLFDLVSRTGKGSVTRETFVVRMKSAHGTSFANSPDLVEFVPGRTFNGLGGGYDIYGCGKSQREGELYEGIAVVHAVYENGDWFFTGWRFVDLDAKCKDLFDKRWEPENDMHWDRPMDEVIPIKDIGK